MHIYQSNYNLLIKKIRNKSFSIGIVGLGYVGLPLCVRFIKENISVYGIDSDIKKISSLKKGKSYITSISDKHLNYFKNNKLHLSTNYSIISKCDVIIICLPTPLKGKNIPDLSYLEKASEEIKPYLKEYQVLILESTVYPGTTSVVFKDFLKKFNIGFNFFIGYSPERENPGDKNFSYNKTPKVISGYSKNCLKLLDLIYSFIVKKRVLTKSIKVAETSKLLENLYRSVNIALVNELKIICHKLNIDTFDVIKTASTKNFGFQTFMPGPGLGGHCIPIDPYYLSWISKKYGYFPKLIETAGEINTKIPNWILNQLKKIIQKKKIKILMLGVSYKRNIDDDRESPAYQIMKIFNKNKIKFEYSDPFFKKIRVGRNINYKKKSIVINSKNLKKFDAAIIITDHDLFNYNKISKYSKVVFDTRHVYKKSKYKMCKNIVFI